MRFLTDCFQLFSVFFLVTMCILSPTLVTRVSFIALLIASLVVIYLVRQTQHEQGSDKDFDPQATMSGH